MKKIKAKFLGVYYYWNNSQGAVCSKLFAVKDLKKRMGWGLKETKDFWETNCSPVINKIEAILTYVKR